MDQKDGTFVKRKRYPLHLYVAALASKHVRMGFLLTQELKNKEEKEKGKEVRRERKDRE